MVKKTASKEKFSIVNPGLSRQRSSTYYSTIDDNPPKQTKCHDYSPRNPIVSIMVQKAATGCGRESGILTINKPNAKLLFFE
jgi:hypothetical protein